MHFTEEPAIVPDQIIESVRRNVDRDTGLHYPKSPVFKPGDTVVVDKGPLVGLQAIFLAKTGQDRVIVLLKMLGRENRITIESDMLRLA